MLSTPSRAAGPDGLASSTVFCVALVITSFFLVGDDGNRGF